MRVVPAPSIQRKKTRNEAYGTKGAPSLTPLCANALVATLSRDATKINYGPDGMGGAEPLRGPEVVKPVRVRYLFRQG